MAMNIGANDVTNNVGAAVGERQDLGNHVLARLTAAVDEVGHAELLRQSGPARVDDLVGVTRFGDGQTHPAGLAQTLAVRRTEGRHRQFECHGVDDRLFEVDTVVGDAMDVVGVGGLLGRAVRVGEQLGEEDRHRAVDRLEAARAGADDGDVEITGIEALNEGTTPKTVKVVASKDGGEPIEFDAVVRIDTPGEADYYRNDGILQYVLRNLVKNAA